MVKGGEGLKNKPSEQRFSLIRSNSPPGDKKGAGVEG